MCEAMFIDVVKEANFDRANTSDGYCVFIQRVYRCSSLLPTSLQFFQSSLEFRETLHHSVFESFIRRILAFCSHGAISSMVLST